MEELRLPSDLLAGASQSGQKRATNGFSPLKRKAFPFHSCGMSPPPLLPGVHDQRSGLDFFPTTQLCGVTGTPRGVTQASKPPLPTGDGTELGRAARGSADWWVSGWSSLSPAFLSSEGAGPDAFRAHLLLTLYTLWTDAVLTPLSFLLPSTSA